MRPILALLLFHPNQRPALSLFHCPAPIHTESSIHFAFNSTFIAFIHANYFLLSHHNTNHQQCFLLYNCAAARRASLLTAIQLSLPTPFSAWFSSISQPRKAGLFGPLRHPVSGKSSHHRSPLSQHQLQPFPSLPHLQGHLDYDSFYFEAAGSGISLTETAWTDAQLLIAIFFSLTLSPGLDPSHRLEVPPSKSIISYAPSTVRPLSHVLHCPGHRGCFLSFPPPSCLPRHGLNSLTTCVRIIFRPQQLLPRSLRRLGILYRRRRLLGSVRASSWGASSELPHHLFFPSDLQPH